MTSEGHDEEDVRRAVVAAVEGIEGPDRGRLARIERRLLADARRRRNPWWWAVAGLGLAAGAAAAYWGVYGGDQSGRAVPPEVSPPSMPAERTGSREDGGAGERGASEEGDNGRAGDGPIIYMDR